MYRSASSPNIRSLVTPTVHKGPKSYFLYQGSETNLGFSFNVFTMLLDFIFLHNCSRKVPPAEYCLPLATWALPKLKVRDWSLMTRRGGYKMGKWGWSPPTPIFLKSANFLRPPPFNMAKTSSYHVKTTSKLVVPPLRLGLNFFRTPFS